MLPADTAPSERDCGDAPDGATAAPGRNREMTTRSGWKPYMFSRQLGPLLGSVRGRTLIAWGSEDRVVPRNCADQYLEALPDARLELVDGAGHAVDMEDPDALAKLINGHIATSIATYQPGRRSPAGARGGGCSAQGRGRWWS